MTSILSKGRLPSLQKMITLIPAVQYKINGFILSVDLNNAVKGKKRITITHHEKAALSLFFRSENGFVYTQTLESEVWRDQVVTQNSLRKLVSSLRAKFEDKDSFKNIRGKGYQLEFEVIESSLVKKHHGVLIKPSIGILVALLMISILAIFYSFSNASGSDTLPRVTPQTVFSSDEYIVDYATHKGVMYVTTASKDSSKVYKVQNRQNVELFSANYTGAFRDIEVHSSGHTVMHVVEDAKCKMKIFKRPVEEQIDEIPCNRQNAFPSFNWIDQNKFYVTYNVELTASVRPYIYNLNNKSLEQVVFINFDSEDGQKFVDAYIKSHADGMFTIRENQLGKNSLVYFEGEKRRHIHNFRATSYSFAKTEDTLYFVGDSNELLALPLTSDILNQELSPSLLLAPQTTYISGPQFLEEDIYLTLGNKSRTEINSLNSDFNFTLENGILDFSYRDKTLSVLAESNTGYVIELLQNETVIKSVYLDSTLNLRRIANHKDEVFLAGSSGIFKLVGSDLIQVNDLETSALISSGHCMLAEADGIYSFDEKEHSFYKLAAQGERPFSSSKGCLYADNLSGFILNEKREQVSKQTMRKMLFEHQERILHWHNVGDQTHIVDVETGETIKKTNSRVLHQRLVSYEDDLLYLADSDVNTSIVKLKL